jgi:endonuclease G, mitochondrial
MKNRLFTVLFVLLALIIPRSGYTQQTTIEELKRTEALLQELKKNEQNLRFQLEELKLQNLRDDLKSFGLPTLKAGDEPVEHAAMTLLYNEKYEQATWVAHIILPDINSGMIGRSNDFRPDSLVTTGSAVEEDYFIKEARADGTFKYDGFGYDRGHLAPSADFRWSSKALSESFLYSNMSPQVADFNRDSWAKLEDLLRAYVMENKVPLYVVTGPVLREGLHVIERSKNKVAIPVYYYKVAWDKVNQRAIAFVMPNKKCEYPLQSYAVPIDSVESLTGIDFFPKIDASLEASKDMKPWQSAKEQDDTAPLRATELPKNHFNTVQAGIYKDKNETITVCGTVVSTKLSSKGNVFLNLDKSFPNQIFTVTIFKDRMVNFSYQPQEYLKGKTICITGKVSNFNGTPSMVVENEKAIRLYLEDED